MSTLAAVVLMVGAVLLVVAAWGVVVLPDALSRQHAATKAGTLALTVLCAGAALATPQAAWVVRLALVAFFLLATLPLASHLLARAAARDPKLRRALDSAPLIGEDPAPR